ncbi:MAG: hypothetical protein H6819_10395 [Phycisphaerales bacterium]|nr:hypothetical protein [Phycisphaerales bacterium]MCB9855963.1 hypothetical protein [Phycisphaerales bacterium]
MAGVTENPLRAHRPVSLSAEQVSRAGQLARRLHSVLTSLVDSLPDHARGASGMSRHLSIVRNTCQRVVTALADPVTLEVLTKLPGIRGLEIFIEGFEKNGGDEANVAAATAAIRQFENFLKEVGGSQAKLAERIEAMPRRDGEGSGAAPIREAALAREHLFSASAKVMGRQCDAKVVVYMFQPHPTDPMSFERVLAHGEIGQRIGAEPMPFAFRAGDTRSEEKRVKGKIFASLDEIPAHGLTPNAILEEFCSDPLPLVTSRGSEGQLVQIIDHKALTPEMALDVIIANRSVHPVTIPDTNKPSLDEVWTLLFYPARHLVFDVYLHRDMERRFRPTIDVQLWGPNLDTHPADRWLTRFPNGPRLQLLGHHFDDAHTDAYPRHAELTRYLFDRVGWRHSMFVGFRCEVAFPIWRSGYCIRFEPVETHSADD